MKNYTSYEDVRERLNHCVLANTAYEKAVELAFDSGNDLETVCGDVRVWNINGESYYTYDEAEEAITDMETEIDNIEYDLEAYTTSIQNFMDDYEKLTDDFFEAEDLVDYYFSTNEEEIEEEYPMLKDIESDLESYRELVEQKEEIESILEYCDIDEYEYQEFYQYYIISDSDAEWLNTISGGSQTVVYSEDLDLNFWCISHWGTSWDYVPFFLDGEQFGLPEYTN